MDESRYTATAANSPARTHSATRILLLLLLAIAIGALIVDQRARRAAKASFAKLNTALGDGKGTTPVTRSQVHEALARDPDDDGNPDDLYEEYGWQGAPYKQTIYVMYWPGETWTLKDVSLNQPLH